MLVGFDIDGVLTNGTELPERAVVISGRTFAEYDEFAKQIAQRVPTYIRGIGRMGDRQHAGEFKSLMIQTLGVDRFYEDDPLQANIIKARVPTCDVVLVH